MTRLDSTEYGDGYMPADSFGRLVDVCTEDWWVRILRPDGTDTGEAEAFTIDIARLRREGAPLPDWLQNDDLERSEEHTSELQSLMRSSYAVFCLKKKKTNLHTN